MAVRLLMVSHASTDAVRDAAFPLDEPLDTGGEAKARALAASLRRVDAAWSSPALRARQTAVALGLDAATDPVLRDIDLGRWAGQSFDAVRSSEPDAVEKWITNTDAAPHGGESIADLLGRVGPWLEALRAQEGRQEGRIVAVSHPAVIRAAVILAIDAKPTAFWRIDIAPLCRVSLRGTHAGWTLRSIG
ncbi:MAG: histidine phosphatase family protein [Acetobacteraceae bacterium]|jgi:broad specificity phosphatase PhoE